jgi:hypothetical protein
VIEKKISTEPETEQDRLTAMAYVRWYAALTPNNRAMRMNFC